MPSTMDTAQIISNAQMALEGSGIRFCGQDGTYIYFQDPSCIMPAFDTFVSWAWTAICILTAFMLLGWAMLYFRNGVKIDSVFKNAKAIILIFSILSVVIPIINFVYHDGDLFKKDNEICPNHYTHCDIQKVSIEKVKELIESRKVKLNMSDDYFLYENFTVVVSDERPENQDDTDDE